MVYLLQNMIRQTLAVVTRSKSITSYAISAASHIVLFSALTAILSNIYVQQIDQEKIKHPTIIFMQSEPHQEQKQLQTEEFVPSMADIEVHPKKIVFHNRLFEAKPSAKMDPEKIENMQADTKVAKPSDEHETADSTQEQMTLSQPDSKKLHTARRKISPPAMPRISVKNSAKVTAKPDFRGNNKPNYPAIAAQSRWEGTIKLKIRVNVDGSVEVLEILKSTGYEVLDAAAVLSVRNYTCKPAYSGSKPIPYIRNYIIDFDLDD